MAASNVARASLHPVCRWDPEAIVALRERFSAEGEEKRCPNRDGRPLYHGMPRVDPGDRRISTSNRIRRLARTVNGGSHDLVWDDGILLQYSLCPAIWALHPNIFFNAHEGRSRNPNEAPSRSVRPVPDHRFSRLNLLSHQRRTALKLELHEPRSSL